MKKVKQLLLALWKHVVKPALIIKATSLLFNGIDFIFDLALSWFGIR